MSKDFFDVIILGSGPAGFYSALNCAGRGFSVLIIEPDEPGGTGFRWGALPVKAGLDLLRAPRGGDLKEAFAGVIAGASGASARIEARLAMAGAVLLRGTPEIITPRQVKVLSHGNESAASVYSCRYLVLASGTSPAPPPGFALDGINFISHRELLFLDELPRRLDIIGGNVEGIELAYLYAGLGVPVTVTEMEADTLPGTDTDLTAPLKARMESMGVVFRTGTRAAAADFPAQKGRAVVLTGLRRANLPLGLEGLEVGYDGGFIRVNGSLETAEKGVFAVGDVNGLHGMAHVAVHQALHLHKGFDGEPAVGDYSLLPRAVFTEPEIAGAGIQENELPAGGGGFDVVKIPFADTWRGFSEGEEGFLKLIFNKSDVLAGIWGVGRGVSALLSASGLLLGKRITAEDIIDSLFIHPTVGEGILEAAIKYDIEKRN